MGWLIVGGWVDQPWTIEGVASRWQGGWQPERWEVAREVGGGQSWLEVTRGGTWLEK